MDLLWPEDLIPSRTDVQVQDSVGRFSSIFNGFTQTIGRPGSRLKMSMQFQALNERKRKLLQAAIAASRGGTHSYRCVDHSHVQAGSWSGAELIANPTLASTTGFSVGTSFSGNLQDRRYRLTRGANPGSTLGVLRTSSALTVTPYRPYVGRVLVSPVRGPSTSCGVRFGSTGFGSDYAVSANQAAGLISLGFVPYASSAYFGLTQAGSGIAGDSLEVSYFSVAPCALVDNGENLLPRSDSVASGAWTVSAASIATTSVTLPDGSSGTVNTLHENSASATQHFVWDGVTVSSSAMDYCFSIAVKAAQRTWARITLHDPTAVNMANASINLTTGALGTVASTGAAFENVRAFTFPMGNDWHRVSLVARMVSTNTELQARIYAAEADGDVTFDGLNQDSIYVWRPTLARSGVPVRLVNTTGSELSGGVEQSLGGGLYTKGWPVSTNGLLLAGDQVEIGGQLLILTGPVNSDAAGLAWLPIPSIRRAPADNEPVIVVNPMGTWIPEEAENGWSNMPAFFSDAELSLIEAA